MRLFNMVIAGCILLSSVANASTDSNFVFDFGVVRHNNVGEPIAFEKTTEIPIVNGVETTLYGLVVTSATNEKFNLNSVHIVPIKNKNGGLKKVMGKTMIIKKRGAIFMRTDFDDLPGDYQMEIYIDNELHRTISYQLADNSLAKR
ncbi:hypothetical protein [Cognaticolwellia mytili]|uniref:hypothetical protein n=1 Tax=Cognaticolwellia mytili TaxID=1888913 RepID=UPI000A16CCBD|nr:hypothetical protein [Cognaticolwellia mytili]